MYDHQDNWPSLCYLQLALKYAMKVQQLVMYAIPSHVSNTTTLFLVQIVHVFHLLQ